MDKQTYENALFVYFDVETTGRSPRWNRICQICAIFRHKGKKLREYETLVNPRCKIPKATTKIHGISDEDVANEPTWFEVGRRVRAVAESLGRKTSAPAIVFVAYNGNFDVSFVRVANRRMKVPEMPLPCYLCDPLKISRSLRPVAPIGVKASAAPRASHKLSAVYERFCKKPLVGAHDAGADVRAMVELCDVRAFSDCMRNHCAAIDKI